MDAARAARAARSPAAALALAGLLALGVLHALATVPTAARAARLPAGLGGPLVEVAIALSPATRSALVVAMVACYAVLVACGRAVPAKPALVVAAVLVVLLTLVPPARGQDLFAYVAYGRMGPLHGVNPYLHGPAAISPDAVDGYYLHVWRHVPSTYGALFTLLSSALTPLGVIGEAWALKVLGALAFGLTGVGVAAAARRLGRDPAPAVLFVVLNPLLLLYALGKGHNDLAVMAALATAIALLAAGRDGLAGVAGVLAAGVKASGALAIPFLVLGARSRPRALAGVALAGLAVLVVSVAAYGPPANYAHTLLGHVEGSGRSSVAGLAGSAIGLSGVGPRARLVLFAAFGASYLVLLALAWRRRLAPPAAAGWAMAAVLVFSTVVFAWYLAWLLPLAAVAPGRRLKVAGVALTVVVAAIGPAHRLLQPLGGA
jgi:hypothetical protein